MKKLASAVLALVRREPVRTATGVAAVVVFVATQFGVIVDEQSVINGLLLVAPVILGGEAARVKVTPV